MKSLLSIDLQYFPCLNWFIDVSKTDDVVFGNGLYFKRSTFRNRMLLPGSNGLIALSIPLVGGRSIRLPYHNVKIDYTSAWQRDHFRTLESVYGNSPYFFHYKDELSNLYDLQISLLVDWNFICLNWFFSKLKIVPPRFLASFEHKNELLVHERNDYYLPSNYTNTDKGPFVKYPQIFEDKIGFQPNMSVLDMLFNLGPQAFNKLMNFK